MVHQMDQQPFLLPSMKLVAKYSLLNTFILDVPYHEKSIKFLQRADLYTIGLIPLNVNP
jgi:hypothetical protein